MSKDVVEVDLGSYSIEQLTALVEMAKDEISRKEKSRIEEIRIKMEQMASEIGRTVQEILTYEQTKKTHKKGQAKFRNPADPEQTWTGRGKRPRWVQEALGQGAKLEDFAINPEPGK